MRRVHDRGDLPAGPIPRSEHELAAWERRFNAVTGALGAKGIARVDERRRTMENMDLRLYETLPYYQRWVVGTEAILIEKGITTREEIDRIAGQISAGR